MTPEQVRLVDQLCRCQIRSAWARRFVRDLKRQNASRDNYVLTPKQDGCLKDIADRMKGQLQALADKRPGAPDPVARIRKGFRRYICRDCGTTVFLHAESFLMQRMKATGKEHCQHCGSTFLEPHSDAAMKELVAREAGTHELRIERPTDIQVARHRGGRRARRRIT